MDDELRKLAQQIQAQKLGTISEEDQNAIQKIASMEPPRPDYSNAIKKDRFNRTKQMLGALPNTVVVDDNYVAPIATREVYPTEEQLLSQRDQISKAFEDRVSETPEQQILRAKRNLGLK